MPVTSPVPRPPFWAPLDTWLAKLLEWPAYAAMAFAAAQVVMWTLAPVLSHSAPPLDVVESHLWGKEWVLGTYKHPALPAWVLEIGRSAFGSVGWPAYLSSQLFIALTFLFVFTLGRDLMGTRRALGGMLLLTGVFYFAWSTIEFNHNVAQMPFWAGIAWTTWRARERGGGTWWVLLGALGAQSLYAKLSSALLLLVVAGWIFGDPKLRRQLLTPWPWVGLACFLGFAAPLAQWLLGNGFQPLVYAAARGAGSGEGPFLFLGAQVLALLGMLGIAWYAGLLRPEPAAAPEHLPPVHPLAIRYLAYMTLVPIVVPFGLAFAAGSGAKSMWGAPMLSLSGLLLVALSGARYGDPALHRIARVAAALLVILPLGYAADTLWETHYTGRIKRQNWPQAEISGRFAALWQTKTGRPLTIVAGPQWEAGIVALRPGPMASILTEGNLELSPWITAARLKREGALVVWQERRGMPNGTLEALIGTNARGREVFALPSFPNAAPLVISYAIVPPE